MSLPLEVLADLRLAVDGENIDIQADGERIVVDLPSLRAGRRILDAEPLSGAKRARSTRRIREALNLAGLTLEIQLAGETLALVGEQAQPGRLGRLLRVQGVEIRPRSTARQIARRRPVAAALVIASVSALLGWLLYRLVRS
jgi:hypothetical protein